MSVLALILGDQLDPDYLSTLELDPKNDTLLMVESRPASESPASHIQRTTLFLSAMRHYAHDRRKEGWQVLYRDLRHQSARSEIPQAIPEALAESGAERLFRSPFFNEFALRVADCERWFDAAVADGLVPGVRLGPLFPGDERFADAVLVTVTELTADAAVDRLVASVAARAAA